MIVTVVPAPRFSTRHFVHLCTHTCPIHTSPPRDIIWIEANPEWGPELTGWSQDLGFHPRRQKRFVSVDTCPYCGNRPSLVC